MRQSTLKKIEGEKIKNPQWNLEVASSILRYAGQDFIYVAEIQPEQYAIVHWADIENVDDLQLNEDNEDKTLDGFLGTLYTRKLIIPATTSEITKIRKGTQSLREFYLTKEIHLIEGLDDCFEEIEVWKPEISYLIENNYLPDPGHCLSEEEVTPDNLTDINM